MTGSSPKRRMSYVNKHMSVEARSICEEVARRLRPEIFYTDEVLSKNYGFTKSGAESDRIRLIGTVRDVLLMAERSGYKLFHVDSYEPTASACRVFEEMSSLGCSLKEIIHEMIVEIPTIFTDKEVFGQCKKKFFVKLKK